MATLAKLIVQIGANSAEFQSDLKKASQSLKGFKTDITALSPAFDAIGRAIKVVGVAIIGAFVAGGVSALASAAKIETYRNSLTTLLGSSQKAGEAVASALALASKTPFTDEQLLAASVALTKFGQDAKTVLPQVANLAAATGGDVSQAAEAYGRFLLGQTKALSAYGINKAMVLAEGAKTEQGIQIANEKGQIVNEAAFETALLSLIDKRSKDGAALAANSIAGLKKSLFDVADDALRTMAGVTEEGGIMAGGLADTFKKAVKTIIAQIEEWKANGSLQEWADKVGKAITAFFNGAKIVFEWLVNIAQWIAKYWQAIVPVMAAVVGAFVGFKIVATYVTLAATAIKLFGSAASIAALGPIALIIGAVAALAAGIVYLMERQKEENALLNPSLAGLASQEHVTALKSAMTEFDTQTNVTGTQYTDAGQYDLAQKWYDSRKAQHQKYLDDIQEQNDIMAKIALDSRNATAHGTEQTDRGQAKKTIAIATTTAGAVVTAGTSAAGAVTKASTSAADAIAKANADLAAKNYDLIHSELQNKLHAIDLEAAADLKAGANAAAVAQWVANSKAQINKDARTTEAAAAKEAADKTLQAQKDAQDKYLASLADYVSKQKNVFSALTSIIIDNYSVQKDTAVSAIEKSRDATLSALDDMISKRQDELDATLDAIDTEKTAAVNALNDEITSRQDELDATLSALDNEKTAVVSAVEKERDATLSALDDMISKRQDELDATLDAISQEKDATLGQYDAQIQALEDSHTAARDAVTVDQLRTNVIYATTAKERTDAQAALDKELADEAYNTQLSSLQKQKQAASDTFDAQKTAAQKSGDAEIQQLKDTLAAAKTSYADRLTAMKAYYDAETTTAQTAGNLQLQQLRNLVTSTQTSYAAMTTAAQTAGNAYIQQLKDSLTACQKSYADQLTAVNIFYDQKMATANINADAEKLLATSTSDQIYAMLLAKLPEYAALGAQMGNALYSNVLAAQGAMTALQQTVVNVQPNGKAPAGLSVGTTVATAGGNYEITAVKPDGSYTSVPVTSTMPSLLGGGSSRMLMMHAEGGYFTTPHVGLIAEKGPEWVVPQSQAASFANQMAGSDVAAGLRQLGLKLDTLTFAVRQVAPGVGSVVNGLGRA